MPNRSKVLRARRSSVAARYHYHLSALDGEELNIEYLVGRLRPGQELVLALNPMVKGRAVEQIGLGRGVRWG